MRCSTNLYLCALGCSDSAVIGTAIFLFCIDSIKRYSPHLVVFFARFSPILYPAGMTAQACSVYFTLVAGADCFINVSSENITSVYNANSGGSTASRLALVELGFCLQRLFGTHAMNFRGKLRAAPCYCLG